MKTTLQAFVLLLLAAPACAWLAEHQQELLTYSAATYDWYKSRSTGPAPVELTAQGNWPDAPLASLSLGTPTLWETPVSASSLAPVPTLAPVPSPSLGTPSSDFGSFQTPVPLPALSPVDKIIRPDSTQSIFPLDPDVIVRAVDQAERLIAQAGSAYAPPSTNLRSSSSSAPVIETGMQKTNDATVRWYRGPQTPDRQNFEYSLVGKGSYKILILGSLYGDETSSALFMDRVLFNLNKNLKPEQDLQLLLIRSANPDGLKFARATNAAGVMLDQNFLVIPPIIPGQQNVAKPAAQLETSIVMRYISEFKPSRVIHLRTTRNARGMIEFGTHEESIAALVLQPSDYVIESLEGKVPANSLASYVLSDSTRTYLNIYLPLGNFNVDDAWLQHRDMLLTALKPLKLDGLSTLKQKLLQQQEPSQSPVNLMKPEGIPVSEEKIPGKDASKIVPFGISFGKQPLDPLRMQGEVELLPSPTEFEGAEAQNTNTGYYELPPPPDAK